MLDLVYAMGGNAGGQGQTAQSPLGIILPFIIIIGIFYFLLIRPQKKQQKKHQEMIENLKKKDRVITSGGIHGNIVNIKHNSVILKIEKDTKIEIQKSSISRVLEE